MHRSAALLMCTLALACSESPTAPPATGPDATGPAFLTVPTETWDDFEGLGTTCNTQIITTGLLTFSGFWNSCWRYDPSVAGIWIPPSGDGFVFTATSGTTSMTLADPVQRVTLYVSSRYPMVIDALDGTDNVVVSTEALVQGFSMGIDWQYYILSAPAPENTITKVRFTGAPNNLYFLVDLVVMTTLTEVADADGDGIPDSDDVCPLDTANDLDGDGICAQQDNCPTVTNGDQADNDSDGLGDPCDPDGDNDGVNDDDDNCPLIANSDQADTDGDGLGDLCDPTPNPLPTYNFTGFFPPVDQPAVAVNKAKAGSAIPVKFKLGVDQGLAIFKDGFPKPVPYPCAANATTDPIESTVSASLSSLSYDAASGQYTYTWKTEKGWATKCLELRLGLNDGSDQYAKFQFTK